MGRLQDPRKKSGLRRVLRLLVLFVLLPLALAVVGYRLAAGWMVSRSDAQAARDPETGWREGMGERHLGDAQAPGAVLFVHGFVGGWNNFADLPEAVAERGWRVHMMRLPGHGTSPRDFERTTPGELQEAVLEEMRLLRRRHDELVVVAHSMGASLAVLAASEVQPDRWVLAAPYFGVTDRWWYGLDPETWSELTGPVLRWVYKGRLFTQVNRAEAKDRIAGYTWVPTRGILTLQEIGRRASDPQVLSRVTAPVLVIHSQGDVAASYQATRRAFEELGSAQRLAIWLERSNHHVFFDHDRERVQEAVLQFIGRHPESDPEASSGAPP